MRILALVEVNVTHVQGPFASKENLVEVLRDDVISGTDQLDGTEGGEYSVDDVQVIEHDQKELLKAIKAYVALAKHGVEHGVRSEVKKNLAEQGKKLLAMVPQ